MATLEYLVATGKLHKFDPELEPNEIPVRFTYFAPEAWAWCMKTLAAAKRDRGRDLTPIEDVESLLIDFALGRPMAYSVDYRKLDPLSHHIWELKTVDVRLIGWFPRKATFVAVCGRLKKELRAFKYYSPCITHAAWFRTNLDLDEPKAIVGVKHNDVL
jgi:hypothetical protein